MGLILEDLYDHEGYAVRGLPDGTLTGTWTHATREFTAYLAACGCGWRGTRPWPPTEEGEEFAVEGWRREHGEPLLARQTERRRDQLARVLEWLGGQRDQLEDPAAVERIGRAIERARGLVADVQRDLEGTHRSGRPPVSAERPTRPAPRRLGEDQSLPGDFLVAFTKGLMDRRAQLLRDGQPPAAARQRAVAEAVRAFAAGEAARDWTVAERRIAQLADDTLGLEEEFRDQHGYEPELARLFATGEVLDGERARQELPAWLLPRPGPPGQSGANREQRQPSQRTRPDSRTDTVRTREGGRER